jgi:serine/threonine protein kinase
VIFSEYAYTLKVGRKGDIYSFGVVLLELLTGKQPADPTFEEGEDLVKWVNKKLENNKEGTMDEILDCRVSLPSFDLKPLLQVAIMCTSTSPTRRPVMREVVKMLKEASPSN